MGGVSAIAVTLYHVSRSYRSTKQVANELFFPTDTSFLLTNEVFLPTNVLFLPVLDSEFLFLPAARFKRGGGG
jgi:hypothetical protein